MATAAVGTSNGLGYAASTAAPGVAQTKAKGADDLTLKLEFG